MPSRFLLLLGVCALIAGCGNARTQPPDLSTPATPDGFNQAPYPSAGLRFNVPRDWRVIAGTPPQVVVIQSGLATVAVWRYPRDGTLPHSRAQLKVALASLVALVRTRDSTFVLGGANVVAVAHQEALQIRALETIDGHRREVRSTHLFANHSEVVIDAYAPPSMFRRADTQVFHPLLRSLRVEPVVG